MTFMLKMATRRGSLKLINISATYIGLTFSIGPEMITVPKCIHGFVLKCSYSVNFGQKGQNFVENLFVLLSEHHQKKVI